MREIVLKRLMEIKQSLLEIKPKLSPGTEVYKQVDASLLEIDRALKGQDLKNLPKEVKVDTSGLTLDGERLSGRVLLSDNNNVYDVSLQSDKVLNCTASSGGFKKLELLTLKSERSE